MKVSTAASAVAAVVLAGAFGAAFAPIAHGQGSTRPVAPRALEVLGGRGSQIGVSIRDLEDTDTRAGSTRAGVVVEEVSDESPAQKSGIRKGDVITDFDGERVRSVRQFTRLVQETPPGRKIAASVMRDGQKVTVTVEPRESNGFTIFNNSGNMRELRDLARDFGADLPRPPALPALPELPARPSTPVPPPPPAFPDIQGYVWRSGNGLGVTVSDLSPQLATYFGTKDGVLVSSVLEASAAAKAGVKAGDVITSLNGSDITDPSDLRRRIQRMQDGEEFTIGVVRDKKALTLKGKSETSRSPRTYRSDA